MAKFNIKVPSKNFSATGTELRSNLDKRIAYVKQQYGTIVDEVAENSNVPSQLIYAMMLVLSQGYNENPWIDVWGMTRSGLFSFSNKVGKEVLSYEMKRGRMNDAERAFLQGAGDANAKQYVSADRPAMSQNPHTWGGMGGAGAAGISMTSQINPINWMNQKIAIQTGAIWIGQIWDDLAAKGARKPLDKVILTMVMPYGVYIQAGTGTDLIWPSTGYMGGSRIVEHRPWNTEYSETTTVSTRKGVKDKPNALWIGGGAENISTVDATTGGPNPDYVNGDLFTGRTNMAQWGNSHYKKFGRKGSGLTINSLAGTTPMTALKLVMAPGGILDKLTVKNA
jgi:hypothetical protein